MKKIIQLSVILLLFSCANKNGAKNNKIPKDIALEEGTTEAQPAPVKETKPEDGIKWMSYDEAVKHCKKKPRKIFVDVYTDWCGWCKTMDNTTFKDQKVIAYMNEKFYAVKLNAESDKPVAFQGKPMTEADLAGKIFKISGYPSTVYLESDEKIIQPLPGYMNAETLDKILHYIGGDHYKTQTWEKYKLSYQAE